VSAHPDNQNPNDKAYDFTTKFQRGENYERGKSLIIPINLVKEINPSC